MAVKMMLKKYLPRMLLAWTVFFLFALLVYVFVLMPQSQLHNSLEKQCLELESQYQHAKEFAAEPNRGPLYSQISDSRTQSETFVVYPSNVSNLTFDISSLANKFMLASVIVKPRGVQEIRDYTYISENQFTISFKSSFIQFFHLLNALERHKPVIFVDTFSIMAPRAEQEGNEVQMGVSVFVSKPAQASSARLKDMAD